MNAKPLAPHETFVYCDCAVFEQMIAACNGMDVVVHLAADPNPGSDWETSLLPRNVIGCYNGFHAASEAGCSRIVFASSVNAVTGYAEEDWHGDEGVGVTMPVWPTNVCTYATNPPPQLDLWVSETLLAFSDGAAKCFGEALGRVYSTSHNLSAICVRFGSPEFTQDLDGKRTCYQYGEPVADLTEANVGITSRDTGQLFGKCIDAPDDVSFAIVNGISKHITSMMDWKVGQVVGYEPEDGTEFAHAAAKL